MDDDDFEWTDALPPRWPSPFRWQLPHRTPGLTPVRLHTPRQGRRPHGPRPQPRDLPRHRWHPAQRLRASRHRKSRGRKLQDRKPRKCRHRTSHAPTAPTGPRPNFAAPQRQQAPAVVNRNVQQQQRHVQQERNIQRQQLRAERQRQPHPAAQARPNAPSAQVQTDLQTRRQQQLNTRNSCELNAPCSAVKIASCNAFRRRKERNDVKKYGMLVSSAH